MKPERILSSDLLDILFEDRNKEYGAYDLRKTYNHRLLIGLCSIPVLAGLFLWLNYLNRTFQTNILAPFLSDSAVVVLRSVDIPEPVKPPLEKPKQKPIATIKSNPPVIVPDDKKADPPPTVKDLMDDNKAISTITQAGEAPTSSTSPPAAEPGGTGEAQATESPQPVVEKVVATAEVMPEFPGGIDALRRFLGRHLRVPEEAMETGQQVKVPVRFVVNKSGELSDVEFLVQVDEIYKKEVLRVMKKMPKWKPGSQHGRQVSVYFMIPIIFQTGE
jgi:periplasmic protein TonB